MQSSPWKQSSCHVGNVAQQLDQSSYSYIVQPVCQPPSSFYRYHSFVRSVIHIHFVDTLPSLSTLAKMARLSSLFVIAFIAAVSVIPSPANAGPACSRRNWGKANCVAACKSKWGWPGKAMGTDPWGAVMQPASSTTSIVSKACGAATPYVSPPLKYLDLY